MQAQTDSDKDGEDAAAHPLSTDLEEEEARVERLLLEMKRPRPSIRKRRKGIYLIAAAIGRSIKTTRCLNFATLSLVLCRALNQSQPLCAPNMSSTVLNF